MQLKFFVLLSLIALSYQSDSYIIKPADGIQGKQAALIFINGAQIPNKAYDTLMRQIQTESQINLFIGLPGFKILDTPSPLEISGAVQETLKMLYSAGLDENAPIFFSGHSLGSIMVQDFLQSNKIQAQGLILTGGYIQRKYLWPQFTFINPTLTIGAELDGLSRITRIAESYYYNDRKLNNLQDYPVVIVPGGNHFQFAGTGDIPLLVKQRDLKAESSQQNSWNYISAAYVDFIKLRLQISDGQVLQQQMSETKGMIAPIIVAYELEGNKQFNSPKQIGGPLENTCVKGGCQDKSSWAEIAQEIIGKDINGWSVKAQNLYVELSSTPLTGKEFHLPVITSIKENNTISVTTYAQSSWDTLESQDTAFVSTSAFEIGVKMSSRQCLIIQGTNTPKQQVPFTVDDPSFCRQANEQAYQYAQSLAGQTSLERFQKYGTKYVFADDYAEQGGPLFLYSHVKYQKQTDNDGTKTIQISSPMQKTEIDYWQDTFHIPRPSSIPDPGCFHYCKLLSPARAIEWIYVDSLRDNYSI